MSKGAIETSHCILGNGYAAIIASHLLRRNGIEPVIISPSNRGAIFEIEILGRHISPVPIFPQLESTLYKLLEFSNDSLQLIEVNYRGNATYDLTSFEFKKDSLADFLYRNENFHVGFGLSLKQWGAAMLTRPFGEVQKKIDRHYTTVKKRPRAGYLNGHSLYYQFISGISSNVRGLNTIDKIDFRKKIVYSMGEQIHYKKLISTVPISYLLEKCQMSTREQFLYEGAYFLYFSHTSIFTANKIVYDCDLESDILRVFSATDDIIMVQLAAHKKGRISIESVTNRLYDLIPELGGLKFERELFSKMSYPTESITNPLTLKNIGQLKEYSVLPFGRFGSWEYLDLHELDWNLIV